VQSHGARIQIPGWDVGGAYVERGGVVVIEQVDARGNGTYAISLNSPTVYVTVTTRSSP